MLKGVYSTMTGCRFRLYETADQDKCAAMDDRDRLSSVPIKLAGLAIADCANAWNSQLQAESN